MIKHQSKNIYCLPFDPILNLKPEHAPLHYEEDFLKYAVDFAMPEKTPILASLDGKIIEVIDKYKKGEDNRFLLDKSNLIVIEHKNKEYSLYAHLSKGIVARKNQIIKQGELIAYSGSTGFTTYPHLHFHVCINYNELNYTTIPTRFKIKNKIKILKSPK